MQIEISVSAVQRAWRQAIFPFCALGSKINGSVMMPQTSKHWAQEVLKEYEVILVESCEQWNKEFFCKAYMLQPDNLCFDANFTVRNYLLYKRFPNSSLLADIGHGCVCIRTMYTWLYINQWYYINPSHLVDNICLCNILTEKGCNIDFRWKKNNNNPGFHHWLWFI